MIRLMKNPVSDITIGPIFEDHGGIIWIGTGIAGLNKFDPDWQRFGHIRRIPVEDGVMHINSVRAIFEDSMDGLWIALDGKGLVYRPANQNAFIHFQAQPGNPTWLSDNFVNRILEWQGEIWIVTRSSGINIYNYTTKQFRRMDNTYLVYEQDRGIHWIWKDGILNKFDTLSGEFVPDTATVGITRLLKSYYVGSLFQDSQRRYWVEIIGEGIIIFNEANGTLRQFKHNPTDRKSISHNDISSVIEDTTGRIWIGTPNGLNRFNEEDTSFSRLTEKEGLPNDYIYSILKDNGGYLWASSNKGIARIDPHSLQIRSYDVSDHLQSNEFNGGAYLRGRNGQLYFGGVAGYNVFHPDSIGQSDFKPPIAITKFIVNDSLPYPITGRGSGSKVILSHIENVFKFEFAALDYANPKSIEYTYMLAGLEDTWVPAGKRRIARYSNVAPGEYTFMVKATNSDGVWNTKTKTIHLTVTPPWWRTKLAYLIYVLLGGTVLYGALQYELNRGRLKQQIEMEHFKAEKLSELDKLKSRFFANISHEFRTPLTLIQGPIESMLSKETRAEEKKQYKMVLRNSHRLQKLVNQLLDLSRIETKQMKLHTTELDIVKTVREIAASFESLAVRNKINFSIDTPDDPIMGWFDRDCVEKIVTNLLANAFKFTSEGDQVILRLQTAIHGDQDSVEITVKDTGIGIPGDQIDKVFDRFYQVDASNMREQEGAGIGLALTKELVELHGGNITVTSEVGESTTFSIKLSAIEKDVTSEETALIEKPPDHRGLDTIEVDEPEKMESPEVRTRDSRHQILIIDDNADMRKYMGSHLETNYRIIEAENGQEGLKKAIKKIPDLIISDVMMPKMDGFALCEKVKTDERSSHIPVILLTAKADSESKLGGLETGADDYLTKPFDPKELQVRIKNLIQQRRRLRQKFMLEASIKPHDLAITSTDEKFLQRAVDLIEEHMSDGKYSIDLFSQEIGMSRMQLHRKLKALTGTSTSGFIRTLRMKHAALLLQQGFGNVAQVAFEVGFNNPSYFSVCFKKQLGKSPTDFIPD
ncbi:MAG: ATP-binding protein [Fidelibacterota bacterium]